MARSGNKESPHILVDARFAAKQRGGDRCRYELAVNLVRQAKMQYTFLGYDHAPKTFADLGLNAEWVNAPFAPEKHPQADYFEHIRLPLLTRQIGADIYHGTFNVMPTLPLLRPGAANIVTVHDMAVFAFPQAYGKRFTQYARPILARAIARATPHFIGFRCNQKRDYPLLPGSRTKNYDRNERRGTAVSRCRRDVPANCF